MAVRSVIYQEGQMCPRVAAERRDEYLQERRERILDAAIKVFASKGLDRANVAELCDAAGIAKGTLYLYFKSKDDIIKAILTERTGVKSIADVVADTAAPLKTTLAKVAAILLGSLMENAEATLLALSDVHRFPATETHVYHQYVLRVNDMLASYLDAQARAGRIRALDDPFLTARVFMGMIASYFLIQEVIGARFYTPVQQEVWAHEAVERFVNGIMPS
jgi:AcrR family transcriptional regulator